MASRSKTSDQLALDETTVEDNPLEAALEARLRAKDDLSEVNLVYKRAHEAAKAELARFELDEDTALRVGRFRITKTVIAAKTVTFETKASDRVSINVIGDDEAQPGRSEAQATADAAVAALDSAGAKRPRSITQPPTPPVN